jgi:hypothetical protein
MTISRPDSRLFIRLGMLRRCMYCGCFQHYDDQSRWEPVPEFDLSPPAPISHGLCRQCAQLFHPGSLESSV